MQFRWDADEKTSAITLLCRKKIDVFLLHPTHQSHRLGRKDPNVMTRTVLPPVALKIELGLELKFLGRAWISSQDLCAENNLAGLAITRSL